MTVETGIEVHGTTTNRLAFVPFSAGGTFNVRLFHAERQDEEGRSNELPPGFVASFGLIRWLSERVSVGLEWGYGWIPLSSVVEHELGGSLVTGYSF
ncbi:MAG: hypothetical protein SFX73_34830 [Kofleriaceae bacterium]|nr:hypothetical protein [Kofleriaceae bacterium]